MAAIKCLIYERDVTGHRLHHVRHLADALLKIGCHVVVTLQADARNHEEFAVHLRPLEADIKLITCLEPRQRQGYFSAARRVDELLRMIAIEQPDWAYVPYADLMTQAAAVRAVLHGLGQFRAVPIEGQVMRGRYAYPPASLRDRLGGVTSRWLMQHSPWHVTHLLDTWVYNNLQGTAQTTEFRLIPEPVEPLPQLDRVAARRVLQVPEDGRYIAIAGGLDPRKGIGKLLDAFARAKLRQDDRVLLVGKMASGMWELIDREYRALLASGRLIIVDRYVSDFELGCGFVAGDVLATPQPRQVGSSGTLVRAAAASRPIIASDFGWVGWVTTTFDLGSTVNVDDTAAFASAIERTLNASQTWQQSPKARHFCQYHTLRNQQAYWLSSLGKKHGLPLGEFAHRVDWNSEEDI